MHVDYTILENNAPDVAQRLLGCELVRTFEDGAVIRVRIVETEAYNEQDPASHSYRGLTKRTAPMFGPPGHAYMYFIYGMYHCFNITSGPEGRGEAVLIRAVEPIEGIAHIHRLRPGIAKQTALANGPGKLCQALALDSSFNNHDLTKTPLQLILRPPLDASSIEQSRRVGLTKGVDTLWRFCISNNPYSSRPQPALE